MKNEVVVKVYINKMNVYINTLMVARDATEANISFLKLFF